MSTFEQMVSARTQKSVFVVGLLLCASVIITLFPSSVRADHFDAENPNPCQGVTEFIEEPVPTGAGIPGSRTGEVPVFDDDTQRNLSIMIELLSKMSQFSQSSELETRRSSNYLRLLCEKEYNLDHTFRHKWARVIDGFVLETIDWVQTVYNNNPIFVTNQSVYYKLVDKGVFNTFLYEIAFSNLQIDEIDLKSSFAER